MHKVEVITNESGDWCILKLDGNVFSCGHDSVPNAVCNLLRAVGCEVVLTEISDEDMESSS